MREQWAPTWTVRRITTINTICTLHHVDRWASLFVACLMWKEQRTRTFYSRVFSFIFFFFFFFLRFLRSLFEICLFYSHRLECVLWAKGIPYILILLNLIFSHYEPTAKHWSFAHLYPPIWFFVTNENGFFSSSSSHFFAVERSRLCIYAKTEIHIVLFGCANCVEGAAVIYVLVLVLVYFFRFCLMYHFDGCVRFRICDWICVRTMSTMADSSTTLFTISLLRVQRLARHTCVHSMFFVIS